PTAKEAGMPEFEALPWFALFAPKGTPRPIVDRLSDALDKALDDPSVRKRLAELGSNIPIKAKRGQQPLAALVKSEIARWAPIIRGQNKKWKKGGSARWCPPASAGSRTTTAARRGSCGRRSPLGAAFDPTPPR